MDIDRDIGFGPARFPISSFGNTSASSRAAPPTPAAKQPAAPNLSAQSSAGRSSKKSARKPAAAASKPSLVRSAGKAPARVSPPQHVTTISDDEDDDEPIPGLVSSEDNSEGGTDSDSGEGFDLDDDDEEVPYLLTSSDDEAHSSAAEANAKPARHGTRAHFNGLRHPPNGALPKQPTPSPAPSRSTAKGKAAPSAAFAEPVSRPAEKGAQAQQATGSAQGGSTSHSIPGVNDRGPKTGHKETGGTPFSFGRAVGGGKAQAADANSTAGAGSKAGSSLPASQHPAYPFPQACFSPMPPPALCLSVRWCHYLTDIVLCAAAAAACMHMAAGGTWLGLRAGGWEGVGVARTLLSTWV